MRFDLRVLQSHDVEILANVAPGVFDRPLNSQLVAEFLNDRRHHLVVAIEQGLVAMD